MLSKDVWKACDRLGVRQRELVNREEEQRDVPRWAWRQTVCDRGCESALAEYDAFARDGWVLGTR